MTEQIRDAQAAARGGSGAEHDKAGMGERLAEGVACADQVGGGDGGERQASCRHAQQRASHACVCNARWVVFNQTAQPVPRTAPSSTLLTHAHAHGNGRP
jgi:hypothetical protein